MERLSTRSFNAMHKVSAARHLKGGENALDRAISVDALNGSLTLQAPLFDAGDNERVRFNARRIAAQSRIEGRLNQAERQLLAALRLAGVEFRSLMGAEIRRASEYRAERRRAG